jgi:hypothetical protein
MFFILDSFNKKKSIFCVDLAAQSFKIGVKKFPINNWLWSIDFMGVIHWTYSDVPLGIVAKWRFVHCLMTR